jgi:MFS family permease
MMAIEQRDYTVSSDLRRDRIHFLLLNIGHFLDHLFTLVIATVAVTSLKVEWGMTYDQILTYAAPGFFAFGLFSLPAGWLADKWSREGMIAVFFVGIGIASIVTAMAQSPLQLGLALFIVGIFAAIYHPVGLAIVTERWKNTGMRIAVNGVWGNLGVGSAALITGYFIDHGGWRLAFIAPGLVSIGIGVFYASIFWPEIRTWGSLGGRSSTATSAASTTPDYKALIRRITVIVFATTAVSSIIFQSTTFALPKVFDERLRGLASSATGIGQLAFMVFAVASIGQLIVGYYLDRVGPRIVFMTVAAVQMVFFAVMPGLIDGPALLCSLVFMLAAFGQIPINDYMISRMAQGEFRARVYGVRYVVSFTALAATLPLIKYVYATWGFDTLFRILAVSAAIILAVVSQLPSRMPQPNAQPATT